MRSDRARVDAVRRRLVKASAVVSGGMAVGHLPWIKPEMKSFVGIRSAWAQATGPSEITLSGRLGRSAPGTAEDTGQDTWEFEVFEANTVLTITVTPDQYIDPEIYLYAPGAVGIGQTNLLTGNPFGYTNAGVGGVETVMVTVANPGVYTFAIEGSEGAPSEMAGDYTVVIVGDKPLGPPTAVVDEGPESDRPG